MKKMMLLAGILCVAIVAVAAVHSYFSPASGSEPAKPPARPAGTDTWVTVQDVKVQGRSVTDEALGVSVVLPSDWELLSAIRRGRNETSLAFVSSQLPSATITAYFRNGPRAATAANGSPEDLLREAVRFKTKQRIADGYANYAIAAEPVTTSIGEHPGMAWSATYSAGGTPWTEVLTRVQMADYSVLFFLMVPSASAEAAKPALEQVLRSAVLPKESTVR